MDDDLVQMIQSSFGSVWTLELLLLIASDAERLWIRHELVAELRSSGQVVGRATDELVVAGLVSIGDSGAVRYAPASRDLVQLVDQLALEYRKKPAAIRRVILSSHSGKLTSFIDAFDLRKSK